MNIIEHIDAIEGMKTLPENSIDSIVTDPPYGLGKEPNPIDVMKDWIKQGYHKIKSKGGFMGKEWDKFVPQPNVWKEVFRVLKPGGYMLCACGTRTQDWMAMSIRFAGFEIRDVITWHYGSGFPKSMNVALAIDKQSGAIGHRGTAINVSGKGTRDDIETSVSAANGKLKEGYNNPVTDAAKQWEGWGTALKPATEFWTLARKPFKGTVAENVLKYGTGGINIDECRIKTDDHLGRGNAKGVGSYTDANVTHEARPETSSWKGNLVNTDVNDTKGGRFPANLILDEYAAQELDRQSGISESNRQLMQPDPENDDRGTLQLYPRKYAQERGHNDSGGASRFFYVAKASKSERGNHNSHPTVKPLELMQYLIKLITPPDGIFLDPFCGSGSTLIAGALIGFKYIGYDNDEKSISIARQRLKNELGMFVQNL